MTDPKGRRLRAAYDAAERRVSATDPAGNRTEWTLDRRRQSGRERSSSRSRAGDRRPRSRTATYDALGRRSSVADPLGNRTTTTYDARGNPRLTIDPEGHLTESTYDGLDRLHAHGAPGGHLGRLRLRPQLAPRHLSRRARHQTTYLDLRRRWTASADDLPRRDAGERRLRRRRAIRPARRCQRHQRRRRSSTRRTA